MSTVTAPVAAFKQVDWPLYSCDDHLDMWALPLDLWTSRLPAADAERAPRVIDRNGVPTWVVGDSVLGISGLPTSGAHGALARGGYTDGLRPSQPDLRLVDMDRDGLYASVIYGPAVLGLPIADDEFKAACWRAWNDFAIEFNAYDPNRLSVLPVLPTHSPHAAAAELQRVAALGHRGALMYCFEFDCGDPAWDRVWAASAETGLPISFHIGGGVSTIPINPNGWAHLAFATVVAMQLCEPLATMIFCGALERHPGMRLVMAEAGLGWLPYFVHRMDASAAKRPGVAKDYQLRSVPSDIFRRQVYITFEEEAHGSTYIELLGADNFMWASDFPHADSTFPESRESIVASFQSLSEADCRKITADNCRTLYKFD
ncbi:MAG TPA: amidohydrolase family protein [Acidimicrobiales bacterium]|nr:amidohydrolase family protein [Acidimicrobiales bacterium]